MNDSVNTFPGLGKKSNQSLNSQLRLLVILVVGIFFAEVLAMIVIYYIHPDQYWVETLMDASIMIVFIIPVLYFFHFRPLFNEMTERIRSEKLLVNVLQNLPVGVWIIDPAGAILHGNLASHTIWAGAKYVGIDQYKEYKAWHPESGKLVEPDEWAAPRSLRQGKPILDEELEIECFDGSHKLILNSSIPIYENEVLQGAIVVNQDITERKQAEKALAKSEALFKTAFQVLPVGAWITDETGNIVLGNPAARRIWAGARYIGTEQFGEYKAWWLDSGQQITAEEWAITRAVKKGETSLNEEIEIECFDGTHKIILNSAIPVYDDQGNIYGVFVVNQDITQRKQFEQALIHSNELIQKAFNSVDILIAYMDRDFNFIQVNESYARNGDHPTDYFPGKNHFILYPNAENQAIFQRVVETGEPYSVMEKPFEYPEFPERGVTYWNWRLQPVLAVDGSVQWVVLSLLDVTERKRAEILLELQNQHLNELSIAEGKQRQLAEGLVQSMLALNASLELQEVLNKILSQIRLSIPYEKANIVLVEDKQLRVVRYLDLTGSPDNLEVGETTYLMEDFPIAKKMYRTQLPILVEDTSNTLEHRLIPGMEWQRSYLAVPLIVGERTTGFINLTSSQVGAYNRETARRLMAFAAPAALAAENARLYAAELHARQLAETLNEVSLALTQTLNFERVMDTLLDYVCRLVPSDRAYIVVAEDETTLTLQAKHGYDQERDTIRTIDTSNDVFDRSYLQEVILTNRTLLIPDTQDYPDWKTLLTRETIRCWLGIPIMAGNKAIGVLALAKTSPNFFTSEHLWLSEAIVSQASVAIQNSWLFEQVRAGHDRLQSLSRRLVEVQENERRYIAQELHDDASQALTGLMFGLRLLEQEVNHPEIMLQQVEGLKKLTDGVLEELHRLAMGLRPASLDYLGLVAALEQLVKDTDKRYNLNVRFRSSGFTSEVRLSEHFEISVYRIVQEALTNAVRHANAKNIDVILERRDGKIIVMIEDDGVGFDTMQTLKSGHLGVIGMQERAQMMSGTLQIESIPGSRTTVVLEASDDDTNSNR